MRQAGRDVLRDIWGGKLENMPGTDEFFAKQKREREQQSSNHTVYGLAMCHGIHLKPADETDLGIIRGQNMMSSRRIKYALPRHGIRKTGMV